MLTVVSLMYSSVYRKWIILWCVWDGEQCNGGVDVKFLRIIIIIIIIIIIDKLHISASNIGQEYALPYINVRAS